MPTIIVVAVIIPATLIFMWKFADRQFYLSSVIIMILAMVPVFARFERKQHARGDCHPCGYVRHCSCRAYCIYYGAEFQPDSPES